MMIRKEDFSGFPPPPPQGTPPVFNKRPHRISKWILVVFLVLAGVSTWYVYNHQPIIIRSEKVESLRPLVEEAAKKEGILDQMNELLAIMEVETAGEAEDVFQASESLGLPPNSLTTEDSIAQGVHYYATLLQKAKQLGVDQDAVFQAYNYGSGYLDYVAENGGVHTQQLAESFANLHSGGRTVVYANPVAILSNGGWRYDYGNMFYVQLVHQKLDEESR